MESLTFPFMCRYLAIVAFSMWSAALSAKADTLRDAVCAMLEYEPELNAAEYDTLSAREDQIITRSKLLPRVSANASGGLSNRDRATDGLVQGGETLFQRRVGLSVRQLLYDGGMSKNETKASRNALLAQQYLEKSMIEARVVDLAEVYLEVIRTRRQIALAEKNVANHQRMRDMLAERTRAGGSRADLALIQGRLGLASSTLATAKLAFRLSEGRYERLTGRKPEHLSYPKVPAIGNSLESIDLDNNHDYLAATEALKAAEHRARATEGLTKPKIYLDGTASYGEDVIGVNGQDNEVSGLVVASWDLFAGGYNKGVKKRTRLQVGKFEELQRTAALEAEYNLNVLWQERDGSVATIGALESYASELEDVASDYQEQFEVGRQELMNILDVQSEAYTAESRLVDAKFDLDTSSYRVLGVQGIATSSILGDSDCADCLTGKDLPSDNFPFDHADPDCRVPLTQSPLMNDKFDSEGPEIAYDSPREEYYVERAQLPMVPSADCKPKGGVFRLFKKQGKDRSGIPIFK